MVVVLVTVEWTGGTHNKLDNTIDTRQTALRLSVQRVHRERDGELGKKNVAGGWLVTRMFVNH